MQIAVIGGSGLYKMEALQVGLNLPVVASFLTFISLADHTGDFGGHPIRPSLRQVRAPLLNSAALTRRRFILGSLDGVRVVFVPRHGRSHHLTPSEVPYKANIYALKKLGVKYILSASAVGSLKLEAKPLDST